MPERQLGLIPAWHIIDIDKWLDHCADFLLKNVNLNQIIDLMKPLEKVVVSSTFQVKLPPSETIRIGIAYDGAFHFYYSDGLETLRSAGAELVSFNPMIKSLSSRACMAWIVIRLG
jgi:cobyrinic acid a,c-diamide synthase